jgi:exodeoxyribonuclease VII large subunit
LKYRQEQIRNNTSFRFQRAKTDLEHLEKSVALLDPMQVVRRGYSMTLKDGKVLQSVSQVKQGDRITTILADGSIQSTVD